MVDSIGRADEDQGKWRESYDKARALADDLNAKLAAAWTADADYYNAHAAFLEVHKEQLAKCHEKIILVLRRRRDTEFQGELEDYAELLDLIQQVGPRGMIEIAHDYLQRQEDEG